MLEEFNALLEESDLVPCSFRTIPKGMCVGIKK